MREVVVHRLSKPPVSGSMPDGKTALNTLPMDCAVYVGFGNDFDAD